MSNKLVSPIFYVYKLTFESGKSYVGSHIQKKQNDNYITSSSYCKKHPEDKIISRDILIFCKSPEEMNFLETWCILSDKAYNGKNNVNWNLGNFVCCFKHCGHKLSEEQCLKRRGRVVSEETKAKISAAGKGRTHKVSEESKQKMRESWKSRKDYKGGITVKQSSEHKSRKPFSEETKLKMSLAHKGKHHSKETKEKISKSLKE